VAWVPARQVTETARLLFEARPVSYYMWSGVGQHTNATQTDRAISTLMALTGSFDAPGQDGECSKIDRPHAGCGGGASCGKRWFALELPVWYSYGTT